MRKFGILLLVAMFFVATLPVNTMAYTSSGSSGDVCATAKNDASMDAGGSKWLWFGAGCLLGPIGILLAYVVTPSVPAARIMGKSSDYVANYTMCYQDAAKGEQGPMAIWGCVAAGVAYLVYYIVVIAIVGSSVYYYY